MKKIYVVYDTVAEKAGSPFLQDTDASAVRSISLAKLPPMTKKNDFELLCVGEMDNYGNIVPHGCLRSEETGAITGRPGSRQITTFPAEDVQNG